MFHRLNMKSVFMFGSLAILLVFVFPTSSNANLLVNGSFEADEGYQGNEDDLAPGWYVTYSSPDLYSNDGSFGLYPWINENFTGVTAFDGLGWVAGSGWADYESFGQQLQTSLTPGADYKLEAYLIQAIRGGLDHPGGYDILLNASNELTGAVKVATFAATTDSDQWEFRNASFTAPANAGSLPWIIFRPFGSSSYPGEGISAYPGMDNLSLVAVPEPSLVFMFAGGGIALFLIRWRPLVKR